MTENESESDEVDVEPYDGEPDFLVPPSKQGQGVDEVQDDEILNEDDIEEDQGGKVVTPPPGLVVDEDTAIGAEGEALGDDLSEPELRDEPDA